MDKKPSWIQSLFADERGSASSKRLVGVLCGVTLCAALVLCVLSKGTYTAPDTLVYAVLSLACACFGATCVDKFSINRPHPNPSPNGEGTAN